MGNQGSASVPRFGIPLRVAEVVLLAILVILAYANTLQGPFILDDEPHIRFNQIIQLTNLSWSNLLAVGFDNVNANRPVANISFGLNYFFNQYNVAGYHLVNIAIHITTGILLYLFIQATINLPVIASRQAFGRWLPFAVALIWLLHPIQTQSVTYIVQRMNSLAAMFYLLAMLCYVRARVAAHRWQQWTFFGASLISTLLAFGSKEIAATLPVFLMLYEWYFFQDLSRSWLRRRLFYLAGVALVLAGLAFFYVGEQPFASIMGSYGARDFTMGQRLLTEFRVVVFYLSLLVFPHPSRLNIDHHFLLSNSMLAPAGTILSLGLLVWLAVLAFLLARRQERLLSFCLLWFLGNMVMESSIIGLEIAFEHRNYLPSMFAVLLLVILVGRLLPNMILRGVVLVIVTTVFSLWTYERNRVWGDEISLWADSAAKSPQKARPFNNLGTAMFKKGHNREAIINYSRALQIKPDHAIAHNNMGFILASLNYVKVAINHYSEAIKIRPDYERAHLNLAQSLRSQPGLMGNLSSLRATDFAESHYSRGLILAELGSTEEALAEFAAALKIDPDNVEAHFQRGLLLVGQGEIDEAIHHFSEVLQINPDDAEANYNLGVALVSKGRTKGAARHFAEALRLQPEDAAARHNLKILARNSASSGQDKQIRQENRGLRIKANYESLHFDLESAVPSH